MGRPRSKEAEQRVLDAAVELIAEGGVSGFTLDAVVRRSGVAKTTIYRRWASGDALLMHALEASVEHLATPNTGSLRGDLLELYATIMAMFEQPHLFRTMLGAMARAASDPDFQRLIHDFEKERRQPLRTILQLAQARGEIVPDADLELMVDFVEGPLVARKFLRQSAYGPAEIETVVDLVVRGLSPSSVSRSEH